MITSQRLRLISATINQKDALPRDTTTEELKLLLDKSPSPEARGYVLRLLRRMLTRISGTWK